MLNLFRVAESARCFNSPAKLTHAA